MIITWPSRPFRWACWQKNAMCLRCVTFYFEEPFQKDDQSLLIRTLNFESSQKLLLYLWFNCYLNLKVGCIYIYIWHPWIDHMFLIILLDMLHVVGFRDQGVFFHRIFIRAFSLRWLEQDGDLQQSLMIRQGWEGKLILIGKMLVPLGWYL